ncbi:hypothetical protein KCU59_g11262, partial [Aureobasidium melanogenum]
MLLLHYIKFKSSTQHGKQQNIVERQLSDGISNTCISTVDLGFSGTYGHSQLKTGHPVRSAIHKQLNGRLVLRWVTTWESLL